MMNTNEQFQNQMKIINDLKTNFDALMKINQQAISNIPSEMMPNKNEIQRDMSKIVKMVEKRDLNSLNKIAKKYAGSNTK